jgi:hypothetical protein
MAKKIKICCFNGKMSQNSSFYPFSCVSNSGIMFNIIMK